MRQKLLSIAHTVRLPVACALCQHYHSGSFAVCVYCKQLLVRLVEHCTICSFPLPFDTHGLCGHCSKVSPYFNQVAACYRFEEPLRTLLHQFKYHQALYLKTFLAQLLFEAARKLNLRAHLNTTCIIPVPMHAKRLRQRGFNPVAELAKIIAKPLNLPLQLRLCEKKINTPAQVSLDSKKRRLNLKQAFGVKTNTYDHIIIVDDLLTTGSTANALALALKNTGVKRVDILCVARAG